MAPRLAYVVRSVGALGPAVDFYGGVLGLTLTKRTEHWAQFDCGSVRLGLYERGAMAAVLGVEGESLGRPPAPPAPVAAAAPSSQPPADRYWGERTAYVLDPDGGLVELLSKVRR